MIEIELSKCTGCKQCETICSFFRTGKTSNKLSRIKVLNLFHSGIDSPVLCQQCTERYCVKACPANAITIGKFGQIVVSPTICTLCRACEKTCPIGAIEIFEDIVYVCDLCGGTPQCVKVCTEGAISYKRNASEEISLEHFKINAKKLNPSEKRANFVSLKGESLRKKWRGDYE